MYNIGDLIVYGSNGVCKIDSIGDCEWAINKDVEYYTLVPIYDTKSSIVTPVQNDKIVMRPVMKYDEAMELLDRIKDIELLSITDERKREKDYKEAVATCDPVDLVRVIKTIYVRKTKRIAEGKKVTSQDERYFKLAENSLYGELAVSLNMDKNEVQKYIAERMEGTA